MNGEVFLLTFPGGFTSPEFGYERRGLLDQHCFALLNNALVRHRSIHGQPLVSRNSLRVRAS